eukprot:CAMPEP_0172527054 /NCGR_PEP_ID=MMETSP1067-20121228/1837_1 /TAXON_ID=265564 ORGANISM="Thalassiosira punctigera, Strain Tpunct2005C2" /NCGR_SAMPLE_ID=MMETSP1067 /ASSEMBLY_ACC=CAM_ASM_000444 /LENGTH=200 /DNA_ID=CAMNT_0013310713 /DNA_START=131 /DNA_END=733 /DNA_ORIENTATION=+
MTRQRKVTFAPLPHPQSERKRNKTATAAHLRRKGFRQDYNLGETLRNTSHMIVEPRPELASRAADSLKKHDCAFIRRSDGSYSYAILAYRSLAPPSEDEIDGKNRSGSSERSLEEVMAFVMDTAGSLKVLKREQWSRLVRLVSEEEAVVPAKRRRDLLRRANGNEKDSIPPSITSFVPPSLNQDEDISLMDVLNALATEL